MSMTRRQCLSLVVLASLLGASVVLPAALDEVARLFRAGRYDDARALRPDAVASGRDGEAAL